MWPLIYSQMSRVNHISLVSSPITMSLDLRVTFDDIFSGLLRPSINEAESKSEFS